MNVACVFDFFFFFFSDGRKIIRIVNIVRCSDVTLDCMLRWIVELDGSRRGLFL